MQQKLKHIYSFIGHKTPWHFRFQSTSPVLRDTNAPGRPKGIFNCDCWGLTPQDADHSVRPLVKYTEDPNTARRFPLATAFTTREACAIECDFFKLVLRRKYYLEIEWSHGTFEAYLDAARNANQEPLERLQDESQWSCELLDFIAQHQSLLLQHRDAFKPEVDLDAWMVIAKRTDNWRLRTWVEQARELEKDIALLPDTARLHTLVRHLNHLRGVKLPQCAQRSEHWADIKALSDTVSVVACSAGVAELLIDDIEAKRRQLTSQLKTLLNNRPQAL